MKELSVGEQRYKAVMAVLSDGRTVSEVARDPQPARHFDPPSANFAEPPRKEVGDGVVPQEIRLLLEDLYLALFNIYQSSVSSDTPPREPGE
jgi:hypothetical protein